jgi:hypothetical protein
VNVDVKANSKKLGLKTYSRDMFTQEGLIQILLLMSPVQTPLSSSILRIMKRLNAALKSKQK